MNGVISHIITTLVQCLIGIVLIEYVPAWLNLKGAVATIVKVIGVLVIIGALLAWL